MPNTPRVPAPNSLREVESWRIKLSSSIGKALTKDDVLGTDKQVISTDNLDGTITLSLPQDIDTDADVEFDSAVLGDLTASTLLSADIDKKVVSVSDLTEWIFGVTNRTIVTDNLDGTVTISTPQDTDENADVVFDSLMLNDLTASTITTTDALKNIVSLTPESAETALKTNYTTGDLDSEAEIIAAINSTNTTINSVITKLENLGILS